MSHIGKIKYQESNIKMTMQNSKFILLAIGLIFLCQDYFYFLAIEPIEVRTETTRRIKEPSQGNFTLEEKMGSFAAELNLLELIDELLYIGSLSAEVESKAKKKIEELNQSQDRFIIEFLEDPLWIRKLGAIGFDDFALFWLKVNGQEIGVYYNRTRKYSDNPVEDTYGETVYSENYQKSKFGILVRQGKPGFVNLVEKTPVDFPSYIQFYVARQENMGLINVEKLTIHLDVLKSRGIEIAPIFYNAYFLNNIVKFEWGGSGYIFYEDENYFYGLTAAHVKTIEGKWNVTMGNGEEIVEVEVFAIHPQYLSSGWHEYDLSLFKIPKSTNNPLSQISEGPSAKIILDFVRKYIPGYPK